MAVCGLPPASCEVLQVTMGTCEPALAAAPIHSVCGDGVTFVSSFALVDVPLSPLIFDLDFSRICAFLRLLRSIARRSLLSKALSASEGCMNFSIFLGRYQERLTFGAASSSGFSNAVWYPSSPSASPSLPLRALGVNTGLLRFPSASAAVDFFLIDCAISLSRLSVPASLDLEKYGDTSLSANARTASCCLSVRRICRPSMSCCCCRLAAMTSLANVIMSASEPPTSISTDCSLLVSSAICA